MTVVKQPKIAADNWSPQKEEGTAKKMREKKKTQGLSAAEVYTTKTKKKEKKFKNIVIQISSGLPDRH